MNLGTPVRTVQLEEKVILEEAMNDDWKQDLGAGAFRLTGSPSECVDEHRLAAYAEGVDTARERVETESHLADCSRCSRIVAFLLQAEDEAGPRVPEHVLARAKRIWRARRSVPTPSWRWIAAAAVIVLAVTATWSWLPRIENRGVGQESHPGDTRLAPSDTHHEPELLWPRDGFEVPVDQLTARWSAVPQALFYEVRLLTASGDLVFEQRVDATELSLPPSARLEPGGRYFMRVEAVLAEGQSLASRHVTFTVEETP